MNTINPNHQFRRPSNTLLPPQNKDNVPSYPTESDEKPGSLRRKGSFSFLRRSKSGERTSTPGRKLSKKERKLAREREMMQQQIPQRAPKIPDLPSPPRLLTFGGEDARPDSYAIISNRAGGHLSDRYSPRGPGQVSSPNMHNSYQSYVPPVPPIPNSPSGDPFARTESMRNRGRLSYASSAVSTINSPRRIRRRKDPTPFKSVPP